MDGQTPLLNAVDRLDVSTMPSAFQIQNLDEADGDNTVAIVDYMARKMKEGEALYMQDDMGFTALTLSIVGRRWRCAKAIIEHVADKKRLVNIVLNYKRTPRMPAETSNCLHLLLYEDPDEIPSTSIDFDLLKKLLECGADANHFNYDGHGSVPLTFCVENYYHRIEHALAFDELLPLTTVDWNNKQPCALDTCGLTMCFAGMI